MVCVVCPTVGWFGGWIGGYIGIDSPETTSGKFLSAFMTANLTMITIMALKTLYAISFCENGKFNLSNIARVGFVTLIIGVIYSLGVNYLLNRYVFEPIPPCCRNKKRAS